MVEIQGGTFTIGAQEQLPEEKSAQNVTINCLDTHEVTNAQFAQFVKETGYIMIAERPLSVEQFPQLSEEDRSPGSVVFQPVDQGRSIPELSWWHWVKDANWRHPEGKQSHTY